MRPFQSLALPLSLVASILACGGQGDSSSTADSEIVGGRSPSVDQRKALMPIVRLGGCTATKVGSRHFLTAAHCVMKLTSGGGGYALSSDNGDEVHVSSSAYADLQDPDEYKQGAQAIVDHVTLDYRWAYACSIPGTSNDENGQTALCKSAHFQREAQDYGGASDLALVVVRDLQRAPKSVRNMPAMPVSGKRLRASDKVTLAGFGCTGNEEEPNRPSWLSPAPELHIGDAKVIGAPADATMLVARYFFSDTAKAKVCPGDSGGPALVERNGRLMVAGVHAGYSFAAGGQQIANWHTRLDSDASILPQKLGVWPALRNRLHEPDVDIVSWLTSEGVDVVP